MTNKVIGVRSGNQIIPYSGATKRTKEYDLTISATNFTPARAVAIAYADSAGKWRMTFNLQGGVTGSPTTVIIAVTGVVFKNAFYQACAITASDSGTYRAWDAYASSNSANIVCTTVSGAADFIVVSGDVELESKPTWADANMEGEVNAAVYIANATTTSAGLIDTQAQTFSGRKSAGNSKVSVYKSANQVVNNTSETLITFDTEVFDTNSEFASSVFTPTREGYYQVSATVAFTDLDDGKYIQASIYKNATTKMGINKIMSSAAAQEVICNVSALVYCNGTTDYVSLYCYHNNGNNQVVLGAIGYTKMHIVEVL